MGLFGGAPKAPKPQPPPPPLPPPQQVSNPDVFRAYQANVGMMRGMSSTILTGGDGLSPMSAGTAYNKPTLGA